MRKVNQELAEINRIALEEEDFKDLNLKLEVFNANPIFNVLQRTDRQTDETRHDAPTFDFPQFDKETEKEKSKQTERQTDVQQTDTRTKEDIDKELSRFSDAPLTEDEIKILTKDLPKKKSKKIISFNF